jgi:hypothetical protein
VLQPVVAEVQPPNGEVEVQSGGAGLHVRPTHSELWQLTSHAHDRPQLTLRHEPVPVQSTLQAPLPQVTFRQLCAPLHVIVHDVLLRQLTPLRHELPVEQSMLQLQPSGHVTC